MTDFHDFGLGDSKMGPEESKVDAEETMRVLRLAMGQKMFGQDFCSSKFDEFQADMFKSAVERIAHQLSEAIILSGQRPVFGTAKLILDYGWLSDVHCLAGKIFTVMSSTPEQFVCFAAFRMEEDRREKESAKNRAKIAEDRFQTVVRVVESADSLDELKKSVQTMINNEV